MLRALKNTFGSKALKETPDRSFLPAALNRLHFRYFEKTDILGLTSGNGWPSIGEFGRLSKGEPGRAGSSVDE